MKRAILAAAFVLVALLVACASPSFDFVRSASGAHYAKDDNAQITASNVSHPGSVLGVKFSYVRPSSISRGIYPQYDAPHTIALPLHTAKHKLFVWLGATGSQPAGYLYIQAIAARNGYNVIGLEYPNAPSLADLCATSTDPKCWGNVRFEILTGQDTSPLVVVDQTNSIETRLTHLLRFLSKKYPRQGWSDFLNRNVPNWAAITFGGHSQGGGESPFIGKYHVIARSCSIEGPADGSPAVPIAAWLLQPGKTLPSVSFGFANSLDSYRPFPQFVNAWGALALTGPFVRIDATTPPFFHSQELYTIKAFKDPLASHNYTAVDRVTPVKKNGIPLFAHVWEYICGLRGS